MSNTWIVDIGFYRDSTFVRINRYARALRTLVFYYTDRVKKRRKIPLENHV